MAQPAVGGEDRTEQQCQPKSGAFALLFDHYNRPPDDNAPGRADDTPTAAPTAFQPPLDARSKRLPTGTAGR
eukprot:356388-Chlamydomonas_euryale.AAC.5